MTGNMVAGVGGLNSFAGMINDVYELEYQALLNDPGNKKQLMADSISSNNKINNLRAIGSNENEGGFGKNNFSNNNSNNINAISVSSNKNGKSDLNTAIGVKNGVTAFDLINTPYKFENGFGGNALGSAGSIKNNNSHSRMLGNK